MTNLAVLVKSLEEVSQRTVASVFREQCENVGWPAADLDRWENLNEKDLSQAPWPAIVYRTGLHLAESAQQNQSLPYHNHVHIAETLVASAWLIPFEYPGEPQRIAEEGLKLLTVMAAHDLDYETIPASAPKGTAEAHSANLLCETFQWFDGLDLHESILRPLVEAVLGTEPSQGMHANAQRLIETPDDPEARLCVLANDADLLPSVLLETGIERGQRLAQEWNKRKVPGADTVASEAGRQGFLKHATLASRAAERSGLRAAKEMQLHKPFRPTP